MMFNSLNVSGKIHVNASEDSIVAFTYCNVGAFESCCFSMIADFSCANALLNTLHSATNSSPSMRGGEV